MSSVMNAVYNNYLMAYTPKSVTRYDTHKKSELKNVYDSIVKINKESPWYLPVTSKDTQHYAVDLKENARLLHNTIAQLGGLEENGLFNKKSAFSSDEGIASATFIGPENSEAPIPEVELEVKALATPQENLGLFLSPDEAVNLPPDTYSFDVGINDMNYEFQFSISDGEKNRELQDRLVRLINNSDIGIKASVEESEGLTSLKLTSDATGIVNGKTKIFTVSDDHTSKAPGTVSYFGIDYISKEASNAEFAINGETHTSSSNHFTIGKMFEVNLNGVSPEDEPIKIGLKTDVDSITDNIHHLVSGYNEFLKAASNYLNTQTRSRQLVGELNGITHLYSNSFHSMGVSIEDDGTLSVDSASLRQTALQSDDIPETFSHIKDFSNALLRKSNQISINPMDYVDRKVVAYKNPGHNFASSYSTSAYTGMMFNSYC